ncbi:MAG: hypothetical protein ACRD22_15845, partial [Terriglobia bacterium]
RIVVSVSLGRFRERFHHGEFEAEFTLDWRPAKVWREMNRFTAPVDGELTAILNHAAGLVRQLADRLNQGKEGEVWRMP